MSCIRVLLAIEWYSLQHLLKIICVGSFCHQITKGSCEEHFIIQEAFSIGPAQDTKGMQGILQALQD